MKKLCLLYIVLDMSQSMDILCNSGKSRIETAMGIIPDLLRSSKNNSTIQGAMRVSVIGFNQIARELFKAVKDDEDIDERTIGELIDKRTIGELKKWWGDFERKVTEDLEKDIEHRSLIVGQTYFTVLFEYLTEMIKRDTDILSKKGIYELYRPVVYFLTDGEYQGDNETQDAVDKCYDKLTSISEVASPAIFAIGICDGMTKGEIARYAAGKTKTIFDKAGRHDSTVKYKKHNESMAVAIANEDFDNKLKKVNRAVLKSLEDSFSNRQGSLGLPPNEIVLSPDWDKVVNAPEIAEYREDIYQNPLRRK